MTQDRYRLAFLAAQSRSDAAEAAQVAVVAHKLGKGGRDRLRAASEAAEAYRLAFDAYHADLQGD